jgi:hypothetical protein
MVNRAARVLAFLLLCSIAPAAQIASRGTPPPEVTADNEAWYVSGAPLVLGGITYYPSGPVTHFSSGEMVPSGMFERVQVYRRTTQEPGSIIYVPLRGGLVRPYERRRSGPLAGTAGSTAPHFPIVLPATEALRGAPTATAAVVPVVPQAVGTSGFAVGTAPEARTLMGRPEEAGPAVGTLGRPAAAPRARPHLETARRPAGLNSIYLEFNDARWFAAGPTVEYSSERFARIGEHRGFPVYEARGEPGVIYIAHVAGSPDLLAPYRTR